MSDQAAPESVLDRLVTRTRRLYSLPAVAAKVLELTSREQVDPRAIKECIEKDPALTAKILRVANSSMFGLRTEVSNLNQAIGLMGIRSLKMLVLGFSLPADLTKNVPPETLERFWRQTVYRAVAARRFSKKFWQMAGDDAFLAGLLGGVGMLALIQGLGETYTQFLDHVHTQGGEVCEQELRILGFDHATLGARMLEHWQLPGVLVQTVSRPRQLARLQALPQPQQELAAVLHLADLAAEFLAGARPGRLQSLLHAAGQLKNLSPREIQIAVAELEDEVSQLAELFSIQPPESGAFAQMFAQALATLSELAESSLISPEDDPLLGDVWKLSTDLSAELGKAVGRTGLKSQVRANRSLRDDGAKISLSPPMSNASAIKGGEVSLASRLTTAIERCRAHRCPVSLVLVLVDNFADNVLEHGPTAADAFVRWLMRTAVSLANSAGDVIEAGEAKLALVLEDQDRSAAVSTARQLLDAVRRKATAAGSSGMRISLGVATLALPSRNFPEHELVAAAQRCLQAAQSSGGDTVKSIEI